MTQLEKLVREFGENVAAQTDAIRRGDPKTGNKHAKRYIRAFQALRALGDQGRDALVPLMFESRDDVRGMAAAFLLRHRPDEARRVLQDLARGEGFVAFSATETLKRWEEGAWQLDPP
jgi:predicted ArsR family transcriptional regulator